MAERHLSIDPDTINEDDKSHNKSPRMTPNSTIITPQNAQQLKSQLFELFKAADVDQNKLFNYNQFSSVINKFLPNAKDERVRAMFDTLDANHGNHTTLRVVFGRELNVEHIVINLVRGYILVVEKDSLWNIMIYINRNGLYLIVHQNMHMMNILHYGKMWMIDTHYTLHVVILNGRIVLNLWMKEQGSTKMSIVIIMI